MNEHLVSAAQDYAAEHDLIITEPLGSGKDGIVLVARREGKPVDLAIKVHRATDSFHREKAVYDRLGRTGIKHVLGFNVPLLMGADDRLRVLEMTIVTRPFILDFASAHLDQRPDFPEEIWQEWEREKREQFEDRWPTVAAIMDEFENLGIYLMDITPNNIGFLAE